MFPQQSYHYLIKKMKKINAFSRFSTFITNVENKRNLIDDIRTEFSRYKGGSIDVSKDESSRIATICLNHPQRKNSFSGAMMSQMSDAITDLEYWKRGSGAVLHGSNKFFCSGGDLNTIQALSSSKESGTRMMVLMHDNFLRFQSLPLITVALIEGMAIGGGAELLTACDFRVAAPDAKIGFVHIKLGITTAWGGGSRLISLIGRTKALDLMTTGRTIGSEEALELGLIDDIVRSDDYLSESKKWLEKYIMHDKNTTSALKAVVNASIDVNALNTEIALCSSVWSEWAQKSALYGNRNIKPNQQN